MEKERSPHPTAADYIYEALVELMKQKPYHEITITDITKKAGVSRMAYYRNYKDKDDILIEHFREILARTKERMVAESKKEYWTGYVQRSYQDPIVDHIMQAGLLGRVLDMMLDAVKGLYQTVYGLDVTDERGELLVYQKQGVLIGYLVYRRHHPERINIDTLADQLMKVMDPGDFVEPGKDTVS